MVRVLKFFSGECIYILSIALLLILYSFNWFCHTQIWAKQINRKLNLAVGAHRHSQTHAVVPITFHSSSHISPALSVCELKRESEVQD